MNITVIYANKRKENSCTYGIVQKLTEVDDRHWCEHGYNEGPALWKRDFENIGT